MSIILSPHAWWRWYMRHNCYFYLRKSICTPFLCALSFYARKLRNVYVCETKRRAHPSSNHSDACCVCSAHISTTLYTQHNGIHHIYGQNIFYTFTLYHAPPTRRIARNARIIVRCVRVTSWIVFAVHRTERRHLLWIIYSVAVAWRRERTHMLRYICPLKWNFSHSTRAPP